MKWAQVLAANSFSNMQQRFPYETFLHSLKVLLVVKSHSLQTPKGQYFTFYKFIFATMSFSHYKALTHWHDIFHKKWRQAIAGN